MGMTSICITKNHKRKQTKNFCYIPWLYWKLLVMPQNFKQLTRGLTNMKNNTVHTTEGGGNFIIAFKLLRVQTSLTSFLKARVFASLKQKQSYCEVYQTFEKLNDYLGPIIFLVHLNSTTKRLSFKRYIICPIIYNIVLLYIIKRIVHLSE